MRMSTAPTISRGRSAPSTLDAATTRITTWRMPVHGEDPRGVWHRRYVLPGTKWADS